MDGNGEIFVKNNFSMYIMSFLSLLMQLITGHGFMTMSVYGYVDGRNPKQPPGMYCK